MVSVHLVIRAFTATTLNHTITELEMIAGLYRCLLQLSVLGKSQSIFNIS